MSRIPTHILQYKARNKRLEHKGIDYQEYLKSPLWKQVREYFISIPKNNFCTVCGSTDRLNIHHKSYTRIFDKNMRRQISCLVMLCSKHHLEVHDLCQNKNKGLAKSVSLVKKRYLESYIL